MPVSISQSAALANRKRTFGEVFIVTLVVSLLVHGAFVGLSALKEPPRAVAAEIAPVPAQVDEIDLVDVAKSSGDSVVRGDEDKAQGGVTDVAIDIETPKNGAKSSSTTDSPAPTTDSPKPSDAAPIQQSPANQRDPVAPVAPHRSETPSRVPPPVSSTREPSGEPGGAGSAAPALAGDGPGDGGGQKRTGEKDLASTFTRALPDAAYYVAGWATLPPGDAGTLDAHLDVGADGKVSVCDPADGTKPPQVFVDTLQRVFGKLKVGKVSLADGALSGGVLHVRVTAKVSDVPAPDLPGGAVALEHTFDKGRGHASFTLESGRRVDFTITVLDIDRAP